MSQTKKDPNRINARLSKDQEPRWRELVATVRSRAGYDVPEAAIIKALMGFTELPALHAADRAILAKRLRSQPMPRAGPQEDSKAIQRRKTG